MIESGLQMSQVQFSTVAGYQTLKAGSVMVWAGVSSSGKTPLFFVDEGTKVNQQVYCEQILESELLPWSQKHFRNEPKVF